MLTAIAKKGERPIANARCWFSIVRRIARLYPRVEQRCPTPIDQHGSPAAPKALRGHCEIGVGAADGLAFEPLSAEAAAHRHSRRFAHTLNATPPADRRQPIPEKPKLRAP